MDITPYVSSIITGIIAFGGTFITMQVKLAKQESELKALKELTTLKIDNLEKKQDKHNSFMERLTIVERETKTQWRLLDEMNGRK